MTRPELLAELEQEANYNERHGRTALGELVRLAIAEIKALEADAARWRYMEQNGERFGMWHPSLRELVDAEIAKGGGK